MITNKEERFRRSFEEYKAAHPSWQKTDSVYLMHWYDSKHGLCDDERVSAEARDFAEYVWQRVVAKHAPMSVRRHFGLYELVGMTERDVRSLLTMIKGTGLQERRVFDRVKWQIEKFLEV